jgi:hypothetical protein
MGEIGQLYKQWFDCFDLYKEQCKDDKPCDKTPVPQTAPKTVPLLPLLPLIEEILEGLAFL